MRRKSILIHNCKKHIFIRLGIAALTLGVLTGIPATDVLADYSVEITPEMMRDGTDGQPDSSGNVTESKNRVSISNGILYDTQKKEYMYPVDSVYVYSNVLDGMITQGKVSISSDTKDIFTLYKNGTQIDVPTNGVVEDTGSYTVMSGSSGDQTAVFSFTIAGKEISEPETYNLPSTCVTTSVTVDGEEISSGNRSVDLSEEGHYVIKYLCVRNNVSYSLDLTVDHTAPTLTFTGIGKDNKARNKVVISDCESDAVVTIQKDGQTIRTRKELTQMGSYVVRVTDPAGNTTVYTFYILFYMNVGGIVFGGLIIAGIVAVAVYLYMARKRMRVR